MSKPKPLTSKPTINKSERLKLAESISDFTKHQTHFLNAYDALKDYNENIFKDLDLQIDTKQQELDELSKKYINQENYLKIECDLNFKQYEYMAALKILQSKNEIAISENELDDINTKYINLKNEFDEKLSSAVNSEKNSGIIALKSALQNNELKHTAETAELRALTKQKEGEVAHLLKTIENLKDEIGEQRKLTQVVAEAGKSQAISQTFGKS